MRFGSPHHRYRLLDSTNLRARELAIEGAPDGTIVTASEQSAGRGRQGRQWSAPPGKALLYSAIARGLGLGDALLPLAVPLAVCEACEALAAVQCSIKWPNDIWIEERKLAGVLIEARPPAWAVVGIGINLSIAPEEFPLDLRRPAVSLGAEVAIDDLREALNDRLGVWLDAGDHQVLAEFHRRDALRDRTISWTDGSDPDPPDLTAIERSSADPPTGIARGVDSSGNLRVELDGGSMIALGAGEVHLQLDR